MSSRKQNNNRVKRVAIVGATGHIASRVVAELLKSSDISITALSRKDSKATFPAGVNVARVDYLSDDSLVAALKGHDFLMITLAGRIAPKVHTNIAKAAVAAGVPYIMPNVYAYDPLNEAAMSNPLTGPIVEKGISDVVSAGGTYIVLACGFWYEWSVSAGEAWFGFDIPNRKATLIDDGNVRINTSTLTLCGKAIAAFLRLPINKEESGGPAIEDWKNKPLYISSFLVSQRDMLASLMRATGTKEEDWTIEHQSAQERYQSSMEAKAKGDFYGFARAMYTRTFFADGGGEYEMSRGLANQALDIEKEDLDASTKYVVDTLVAGRKFFDVGP